MDVCLYVCVSVSRAHCLFNFKIDEGCRTASSLGLDGTPDAHDAAAAARQMLRALVRIVEQLTHLHSHTHTHTHTACALA